MRRENLQSRIVTGRYTLPVAILLFIACWLTPLFAWDGYLEIFLHSDYFLNGILSMLFRSFKILTMLPDWLGEFLAFALFVFTGYLLIALNNSYGLIRIRASVQTSIFFLLIGILPTLHLFTENSFIPILALLSLFFLFRSYQNHKASADLFHCFCFWGIATLIAPKLMWLTPVWILGAYNMQSLTIKSFFAALTGLFFPYWFLLGHAYFHGQMELFYLPFKAMSHFSPLSDILNIHLSEWILLAYLFVMYIVSGIHILVKGYQDKIRTRSYLHFILILVLSIFLLILLQSTYLLILLSLLIALISILAAHFFVLSNNRGTNLFFVVSLIGLFTIFGYTIWSNL